MGRPNTEQNRTKSKEVSRTPNTTKQCPNTEHVQDPNKKPNTFRNRTPNKTPKTNKRFPNTEQCSGAALLYFIERIDSGRGCVTRLCGGVVWEGCVTSFVVGK